jgi:hypothetical protein
MASTEVVRYADAHFNPQQGDVFCHVTGFLFRLSYRLVLANMSEHDTYQTPLSRFVSILGMP